MLALYATGMASHGRIAAIHCRLGVTVAACCPSYASDHCAKTCGLRSFLFSSPDDRAGDEEVVLF